MSLRAEELVEGARVRLDEGGHLVLGRALRGRWKRVHGWQAQLEDGTSATAWWFEPGDARLTLLDELFIAPPVKGWRLAGSVTTAQGALLAITTGLGAPQAAWGMQSTPVLGRMVPALLELAGQLSTLHRAGLGLGGMDASHLAIDAHSGALSIWGWGSIEPLKAQRGEAAWRDLRVFGDLVYQAHTGKRPIEAHELAARLQSGDGARECGLATAGVAQVLAGCVTPHGDLAYLEVGELVAGLKHLQSEVERAPRLVVGAQTTLGSYIFRKNNQDACGHLMVEVFEGSQRVPAGFFCVADGIGGIQDGERASALAVRAGCAAFARLWANHPEQLEHAGAVARGITRVVSQELVMEGELSPTQNRGGTTYTGIVIAHGRAGIGHVGDSRAYLWREGTLWALTQDHNLSQIQEALGMRVLPGSAEEQTGKRTIARFLSTAQEIETDRIDGLSEGAQLALGLGAQEALERGFALRRGDVLLLCSDGLHGELEEEELVEALELYGDPQVLCDALVEQAVERRAHDNVTALAVRIR